MEDDKYRVWCLTMEETEDDGRDVIGFDPASDDAPPKGCLAIPFYNLEDASEAAAHYARWEHDNRNGYTVEWPLIFRVRKPDGSTEDFEVDRIFTPSFNVAPVGTAG